jgi:hypothetical protein
LRPPRFCTFSPCRWSQDLADIARYCGHIRSAHKGVTLPPSLVATFKLKRCPVVSPPEPLKALLQLRRMTWIYHSFLRWLLWPLIVVSGDGFPLTSGHASETFVDLLYRLISELPVMGMLPRERKPLSVFCGSLSLLLFARVGVREDDGPSLLSSSVVSLC